MNRPYVKESAKPSHLDADRTTPLRAEAAQGFAQEATRVLNERASQWLRLPQMAVLAEIISADGVFPFRAELAQGRIELRADLHKLHNPTVKDVSDGLSHVCMRLVATLTRRGLMPEQAETFKFAFPSLLHPALREVYAQSGLESGPHTKYVCRG